MPFPYANEHWARFRRPIGPSNFILGYIMTGTLPLLRDIYLNHLNLPFSDHPQNARKRICIENK